MTTSNQAAIQWERDWDTAVRRAQEERRLLLIDVEKED